MKMRIMSDTLRDEMGQIMAILSRWKERVDAGVPGDEMPASENDVDVFRMQLRGELQLAADRLMALVEVTEEQ